MNIQDWFIKWNRRYNNTGNVSGQCVNVIKSYFQEVLGIPPVLGDAITYWNFPPKGFMKIPKGNNQPLPGDIMIFNIGQFGHICVCNWSRPADFQGFEQNFPVGTPCHFQDHKNYNNVLGWLRFVPKTKFVMKYTAINTLHGLLEQAQELLIKYSQGALDCTFSYSQIPPIVSQTLWTTEEQMLFLKNYPQTDPFVFLTYTGNDSGHLDQVTLETPGTPNIVTASFAGNSPLAICYEFTNAIYAYLQDRGFQVTNDDPQYPSEEFITKKLTRVIPYIAQLK